MAATSDLIILFFVLAVGRESVLAASSSRELQCGRRLVTGLFSRMTLPLGYSYVATIPRGACNVRVTELLPSDNYIALKITNGSYIINGMFAVSSPGTYDVAGSRFIYMRTSSERDTIIALGPIQVSIDIMILYTQNTIEIKYEYLTESLPGEENIKLESHRSERQMTTTSTPGTKHFRKHHNLSMENDFDKKLYETRMGNIVSDGRAFMWKILSYSHCSRTCGGGIQIGKYRCVEQIGGSFKEVDSIHCQGPPPAAHRRKCEQYACLPRWRTTAWSTCPECGPAERTRIVGCIQDNARGIIKVSDFHCVSTKPATSELCKIPDCVTKPPPQNDTELNQSTLPDNNRQRSTLTETFRDVPLYTVNLNEVDIDGDSDVEPVFRRGATAGWLYTDWSECTGWCVGGGIQTRRALCADPSGCAIPRKSHDTFRYCTPKETCDPQKGKWFTGEWSPCSSNCGGKQIRGVLCLGAQGTPLLDSSCATPKPKSERDCGELECSPTWYYSKWSQCIGNCTTGHGFQRRTVWCAKPGVSTEEHHCDETKPESRRYCTLHCSAVTASTTAVTASTSTVTASTPAVTTSASSVTASTKAADLTIESEYFFPDSKSQSKPRKNMTQRNVNEDCIDKLKNCALAVQARLCRYNYYIHNCCTSCRGRNR